MVNTKGENASEFSQEFLDFMEYINRTTDETAENSGSEKIRNIHKTVKKIRKSEKAGIRIMQRWEELVYAKEDGIREGRAEGERLGREAGERLGREAGKTEGLAQGIIETALECGLSEEKILEKLQIRLHIPPEKAAKYLENCSK